MSTSFFIRIAVTGGLMFSCGVLAVPAQAGGLLSIVRVGAGAGCDFATLSSAIAAASTGADDLTVIRLATSLDDQELTVVDRNVTIDGRYPTCASETPDDGARRTLGGSGGDSVMRISNSLPGDRTVTLRNLIIRDGGPFGALGSAAGGGLFINGRVIVEILDSRISDNESYRGGGIYVAGDETRLILDDNTIVGADGALDLDGNRAIAGGTAIGRGGGIHCAGASLTLHDARVRANTTAAEGGGIYASGCRLTIEPRAAFAGNGDGFVTLFLNSAGTDGGGLYATSASEVFWRSLPTGSFGGRAAENSAGGRGGAVFLSGASDFVGDRLRIEDNSADGRGGGFAVQDSSNLILRGGAGFACSGANCPGIFGTRGITEGESATLIGGAVHAEGGSTVSLRQQHLVDNFSNNGSALHLAGSTTNADLRSVLIARNVLYGVGNGTSTVELTGSADLEMRYVTMMGNFRASNVFPGLALVASSIRANGNGATVELRNSLFWNDAELVFRALVGASASGSCVLAHENTSFGAATVADPLYVDTTGSDPDFSLQAASPAIDRCAASGTNEADVFGTSRPQNVFARPDLAGPFDAGAIEQVSDDVIFADGFELP